MNLSAEDVKLFYKLWCGLIYGINKKHKIIPPFKKPVYGKSISIEPFIEIRGPLWENPQWIGEFLRDCDDGEFTEVERGIIASWGKHFVAEKFVIIKHLAKYSVFMTLDADTKLYGVCGISDPVKEMVGNAAPLLVEAVLLPFKDIIIFDSILGQHSISFGKGMRDSLQESYRLAREKAGIFERLDGSPATPVSLRKPQEKAAKTKAVAEDTIVPPELKQLRLPKPLIPRYLEISGIITRFCDELLNSEYKEICLHALAKLCRKRPSPLESGRANTWACGIIYAIGSNNFLFDKSHPPYVSPAKIADWFGLAKSTAGSKAAEVKKILDISWFSLEYCLQSNPVSDIAKWYVSVNGYVIDIRNAPRELQEEAFARGLIPYIPD